MVQGDISRFQMRLAIALQQVKPQNQEFVILPFLDWLANPEQSWSKVMIAVEGISPTVKFTWDWSDITPAIECQDAATQEIARLFIAFFEGKIDLEQLKLRLGE